MREVHRSQFQLGQVPVEKVWINPKSRDDIPAVLKGLQHIWCDEALRARLFVLLDEHILPEADRTVGRPGMDLWQILVLGVLKQGLGCDFDRLHDLTNHHQTIRAFLGHGDFDDKTRYEYQTVVDNVSLLTPELLSAVGRLVVESGTQGSKKKGLRSLLRKPRSAEFLPEATGRARSADGAQHLQEESERHRRPGAGDAGVHGACLPVMRASTREETRRISFTSRSSSRLFSIHSR